MSTLSSKRRFRAPRRLRQKRSPPSHHSPRPVGDLLQVPTGQPLSKPILGDLRYRPLPFNSAERPPVSLPQRTPPLMPPSTRRKKISRSLISLTWTGSWGLLNKSRTRLQRDPMRLRERVVLSLAISLTSRDQHLSRRRRPSARGAAKFPPPSPSNHLQLGRTMERHLTRILPFQLPRMTN